MTGFIPTEGLTLIADMIFKRDLDNRDADLEIGLFTDSSIDETITEATITEPSGNGYARQTLTDGDWTGSGATLAYPQVTFTPSGGSWDNVYGYFIATKSAAGTQTLITVEIDSAGPYNIGDGQDYKITPGETVSSS